MNEKTDHLHYSSLTRTLEDDMWIIDSVDSRNMIGYQARISNINEKKTSYKVEMEIKTPIQSKELVKPTVKLKTCNNFHLSNVLYVPI
jgi:hypothetical protein